MSAAKRAYGIAPIPAASVTDQPDVINVGGGGESGGSRAATPAGAAAPPPAIRSRKT